MTPVRRYSKILSITRRVYGELILFQEKLVYQFLERPRGLDFSKQDIGAHVKDPDMQPFKKTPSRFLKLAFQALPERESRAFLDIGCGKGYVLKCALEHLKISKWGGIEYDRNIAQICQQNLIRLGYTDGKIWYGDAREYGYYEYYDTYFLFNPFIGEIFREVLKKLPADGKTIIYVNPVCHEMIVADGRFRLVKQLQCGCRATRVYIYEGSVGAGPAEQIF